MGLFGKKKEKKILKVLIKAVLVMAVKGGTGKTMVARELILHLSRERCRIAALDSDIDSPNLAESLGVDGWMGLAAKTRNFIPIVYNETVSVFSTSLYHPEAHRGWTKTGEQNQGLLRDAALHTDWGDVDLFIIDMPAGSSDEFRAIKSLFDNIAGVVVVTQPNTLPDLQRVFDITSRFNLPILAVVENQHEVECSKCGAPTILFHDYGKVEEMCGQYGVMYAGAIGWSKRLQQVPNGNKDPMPDKYRPVIHKIVEAINGSS